MFKTCGIAIVYLFCSITDATGQLLKKVADAAKTKIENKVVQKTEAAIDKTADGKWVRKDTSGPSVSGVNKSHAAATETSGFGVYSTFDFIPGERVLVLEEFSQDAVGDFPAKWNTNASGEVVTTTDRSGNWLRLQNTGVYMPENITNLPENFTLEFDLLCNPDFRYSASPLYFAIASLKTPKDYVVWQEGWGGRKGFLTWVQPNSPTGKTGKAGYRCYTNNGEDWGEKETSRFHAPTKNKVKVSIWRQKQRVRVYLDDEKIADIAKGLDPGDYNSLVFTLNTQKTAPDGYLLSNIRLAVGAPDTRNKLLNDGRFVTTGILFDVASDRIQPSSYGVLKEIASTLQGNTTIKIRIVGHTDGDGDAAVNKSLSERRAAAVKRALESEFGIAPERMQTAGKGEAEPVGNNKTQAGKAQNRRVEFVKV